MLDELIARLTELKTSIDQDENMVEKIIATVEKNSDSVVVDIYLRPRTALEFIRVDFTSDSITGAA